MKPERYKIQNQAPNLLHVACNLGQFTHSVSVKHMGLSLLFLFVLLSSGYSNPLIWNTQSIKHAAKEKPNTVKHLLKEANLELSKKIISVVDKPKLPPSGDKHDYMSMGRYWWPNPETKDGLPYIRKDGVTNPEIEKLDRIPLAQMTRSIKLLSLAYAITGKEKYAQKAVSNLQTWFLDPDTKMNPHLNFGQIIPGRNNNRGRREGVIDTYSFVEMLEGVELLKNSNSYTSLIHEGLKAWFEAYLQWMLHSPIGKEAFASENNHGVAFDVQVVRYALFVGNREVAQEFMSTFAQRRIFSQIHPDGSQPLELARTLALGYSVFNLKHMLDISMIAHRTGFDIYNATSQDGRSIRKAIDFLIPFVGISSKEFPYQQIRDWESVQRDLKWQLHRAATLDSTLNVKQIIQKVDKSDWQHIYLLTI